jgi:hypothetical protein
MLHLMSFKAFNNLVLKLTLFLQSQCMNFVRPQLEIKIFITICVIHVCSWNQCHTHGWLI